MESKNLLKKVLIISGALLVLAACSPEKEETDVRRKKGNIEEARRNIEEASNQKPDLLNKASVQAEESDVMVAEEEKDVDSDSYASEAVSLPEVNSLTLAAPAIDNEIDNTSVDSENDISSSEDSEDSEDSE